MFILEPDLWASRLNRCFFSLNAQNKGQNEMGTLKCMGPSWETQTGYSKRKSHSPQKQATLQFSRLPPPQPPPPPFPPASDGKHPKSVPFIERWLANYFAIPQHMCHKRCRAASSFAVEKRERERLHILLVSKHKLLSAPWRVKQRSVLPGSPSLKCASLANPVC